MRPVLTFVAFLASAAWFFLALNAHAESGPQIPPVTPKEQVTTAVEAPVGGVWNAWVVLRSPRRWYAKTWAVVLALAFVVGLWVGFAHNVIAFDVNY